MSKAKEKTAAAQDQVLPSWFDEKKHSAGDGGIFETATGTLLAEDGEPLSQALRIQRAMAAAAPEATQAADPAAETPHHSV